MKRDQQQKNFIRLMTEQVASLFGEHSAVVAVYLLGSVVTGKLRDDSDIDIALLAQNEQTISVQARLEMAALLEAKLNRTVDIGVITSKNLIYASSLSDFSSVKC